MIESVDPSPRYTQPEVLKITGLAPAVLQTWINRGAIQLAEQNPGYGRRRLYGPLDVVKLAIMRRMADLNIALSVSREIAEAAVAELAEKNKIDWNLYISLRPGEGINTIASAPLMKYGPTVGDPRNMLVSEFVAPFESGGIFSRRDRQPSGERPINPQHRELLARSGIHAEPVIIFPLGEVVNGALAQMRALDEASE